MKIKILIHAAVWFAVCNLGASEYVPSDASSDSSNSRVTAASSWPDYVQDFVSAPVARPASVDAIDTVTPNNSVSNDFYQDLNNVVRKFNLKISALSLKDNILSTKAHREVLREALQDIKKLILKYPMTFSLAAMKFALYCDQLLIQRYPNNIDYGDGMPGVIRGIQEVSQYVQNDPFASLIRMMNMLLF